MILSCKGPYAPVAPLFKRHRSSAPVTHQCSGVPGHCNSLNEPQERARRSHLQWKFCGLVKAQGKLN